MADDEQPPDDGQQNDQLPDNGPQEGQADAQLVMRLVQQFTEAVRELADGRPTPSPDTYEDEGRALRQRIDFGYRALATLTGRLSRTTDKEFDVPTFAAARDYDSGVIQLFRLPDTVTHVELRAAATAGSPGIEETVKVIRYGRGGPNAHKRLEPKEIALGRAIDSMIGLGGPTGPLLALGPRLAALHPESATAE